MKSRLLLILGLCAHAQAGEGLPFYHSPKIPLFALTTFAKGRRADLAQAERNGLRALAARLRDTYLKNLCRGIHHERQTARQHPAGA